MVAAPEYGHAVADELSSDPLMRRDPQLTRDITSTRRDSQIRRAPNSAGLYEVLDLILDKGIVVDAFVRVSLVGIELLTVDLRVVIASVDTYLRYAEGVERLQVYDRAGSKRLPDMVGSGMKTHAVKKGAEKVGKALTGGDDEGESDNEENGGITGTLTRGVKKGIGKLVHTFTGSDDEGDEGEDQDRRQGRGQEKQSRFDSRGNNRDNRDNREREPARMGRENGNRPHKLQHAKR